MANNDILLTLSGDMAIDASGDISLTGSPRQAITIRLLWFIHEWRLGPKFGIPYYEDVFIKNPNENRVKQLLVAAIRDAPGVVAARITRFELNKQTRDLTIAYQATVNGDYIEDEVMISG